MTLVRTWCLGVSALSALLLSLVLIAVNLLARPLIPIDETRYLAVAWDMHLSGDYLVPHLNGEPYSHKPPLLFWLINAVWSLTGVQEWSARLVAPLTGVVSLILTARLAKRLWPETREMPETATLILASTTLWMLFSSMTMFDTLLTVATLTSLLGCHMAATGERTRGLLLMALAIGGGILAKGPVMLLHALPAAVLAPLWIPAASRPRWRAWYAGVLLATLAGIAIALAWAIPAARAGGTVYGDAILWGQTAGRVTKSFAHGRPLWWYLPLLPAFLLPWTFSVRGWRMAWALRSDAGARLCAIWFGVPLLAFSCISGKQLHYLVPELPALALLLAAGLLRHAPTVDLLNRRGIGTAVMMWGGLLVIRPLLAFLPEQISAPELCDPWCGLPIAAGGMWIVWGPPVSPVREVRRIALVAVVNAAVMLLGCRAGLFADFRLDDLAREVARLQQRGVPLVHDRQYHGELHFAGRLTRWIDMTETDDELAKWMANHPEGCILRAAETRDDPRLEHALFVQPYRRDMTAEWLGLVPVSP